ncbi:hypothetical protein [Phytohabitans rumicis]|uniref:Uncharacterized protein n=1 Tax=Phytohabitans rumicis TaxID=1076125 RepID=A0A6V8LDV6_9ACTN|nr:hypothetical protein [Phytohabitans rumicis]GFJ92276.1 hypothetical protein Prum_059180 [Phytohabitans rumicis]
MQPGNPYHLIEAMGSCQVGSVWSAVDAQGRSLMVALLDANAAADQRWREAFAAAANTLVQAGEPGYLYADFATSSPWVAYAAENGIGAERVFLALGMEYQPVPPDQLQPVEHPPLEPAPISPLPPDVMEATTPGEAETTQPTPPPDVPGGAPVSPWSAGPPQPMSPPPVAPYSAPPVSAPPRPVSVAPVSVSPHSVSVPPHMISAPPHPVSGTPHSPAYAPLSPAYGPRARRTGRGRRTVRPRTTRTRPWHPSRSAAAARDCGSGSARSSWSSWPPVAGRTPGTARATIRARRPRWPTPPPKGRSRQRHR